VGFCIPPLLCLSTRLTPRTHDALLTRSFLFSQGKWASIVSKKSQVPCRPSTIYCGTKAMSGPDNPVATQQRKNLCIYIYMSIIPVYCVLCYTIVDFSIVLVLRPILIKAVHPKRIPTCACRHRPARVYARVIGCCAECAVLLFVPLLRSC
jgi:hypothetical protein